MDAAKKETEASDGKHPGCAVESWEGRDSPTRPALSLPV